MLTLQRVVHRLRATFLEVMSLLGWALPLRLSFRVLLVLYWWL